MHRQAPIRLACANRGERVCWVGLPPCVAVAAQSPGPANAYEHLASIGQTVHVYVTGNYPGGNTYDLTPSVTGTHYLSSDTRVIAVDARGDAQAVGFGTASVRARNGGARTFVNFVVEDPARSLPLQDLTAHVAFDRSPLTLDASLTSRQKTSIYTQNVTITNASDWPLIGPLYLTVKDLVTKDAWLFGFPPDRSVYYLVLSPNDGLTLGPGERVTATLQFWALRSPTALEYRLGVMRYGGDTDRLP